VSGLRALLLWAAFVPAAAAQEAKSLAELCQVHRTDKCAAGHGYVEFYEDLFRPLRGRARRILEIGVAGGESLRLWRDYFPGAQVFGLDIYDKKEHDSARITTMVADQAKREDLAAAIRRFGGDFDIVIDDGGHRMDQQQISFAVLFPALQKGGLYVIEDVHTSFPSLHPGYGVFPGGGNSTYAMIDRFVRTGKISSRYLSRDESRFLSENISYCAYFFRPTPQHSDIFICRRS
jgi:hypothetical protein